MTPRQSYRFLVGRTLFAVRGLLAMKNRRHIATIVVGLVIAFAATAGVWAAFQGSPTAPPPLAAMLPQGALLTIESKDFAGLLKRWNDSPEKSAWLKSDNLSIFSRSRLFGRLGDAQNEFAQSANLPPDMNFLNEVAGGKSVFAWYDIGKLEFLYITRMPAGGADKTRLVQMRGKFAMRQVGNQTFYVRTKTGQNRTDQSQTDQNQTGQTEQSQGDDAQGQARTVAFATSGDWMLLATREDLMAGALTLMTARAGSSAPADSLAAEPWFVDAWAAAGKDAGELRMSLNLEKIVPSLYFRSYWVQRNVTEMKQYRSAVADLFLNSGDFREERVLLPKAEPENSASAPDLGALMALLPQHSGVYRAVAAPGVDAVLDSINEKLLQRTTGSFADAHLVPDADVSVHEAGSTTDFETRIDAASLAHPVRGAELAALRQTLAAADPQAMMTVSRTGDARGGIWVPFQSAVVLSAATDWDAAAMQAALQRALEAHITAGDLGLAWKSNNVKGGSYVEASDSRPLELAVRGKLCILADDAELMQEMLGQTSDAGPGRQPARKTDTKSDAQVRQPPATLIAGFDLAQERSSFARWSRLVDRTNAGPAVQHDGADADGSGGEPSFFSQNMRSLGDVFAALESERVVERGDGKLTRQTVTYAWRH
jgi:hypothetical protein